MQNYKRIIKVSFLFTRHREAFGAQSTISDWAFLTAKSS